MSTQLSMSTNCPPNWASRFDAFVAMAVWEHLRRPWLAAEEVARVLAPGGICYIETHQTFPLHGFPHDYFRFSREALAGIFADAGLVVIGTEYKWRSKIIAPPELVPDVDAWNAEWPSWLNVALAARKP